MKFKDIKLVTGLLMIALFSMSAVSWAQQDKIVRKLTNIKGDLYRFQNKFHFSAVYVTKDGVIITDPINAEAATWLKAELKKRFNKPVKYVIYSHDHRDHIAGGEVYADTATFVSHVKAKEAIIAEKRPTQVPDITFSDTMSIKLGGKTVELTYVGPSHSDNMIVINFPAERVLHVVDIIVPGRVPFKDLSDSYFPGFIDALKLVENMDYDILSPAHGPLGKKSDATQTRQYMEDIYNSVIAGLREGKTLDQLQASVTMDKYNGMKMHDKWVKLNVLGVYRRASLQRRGN